MRNLPRRPLAVVLLLALAAPACGAAKLATTSMDIKGKTFVLEIATTDETRETGLMYRDSMPADHGMIFVFDKDDTYSFWMHNTRIDLDGVWIAADGTIVFIETMKAYTETSHTPPKPARYVIELNAGAAKTLGLKVGDKLAIPDQAKAAAAPAASQPAASQPAGTQPAR